MKGSFYKQNPKNNKQAKVSQVKFLRENKLFKWKKTKTFENVFEYSQVEATSSDRLINERWVKIISELIEAHQNKSQYV